METGEQQFLKSRRKPLKADIATKFHVNRLFNSPSEQVLSDFNKYLDIFDKEQLQFKRSKREVKQIKTAVLEAVIDFVFCIGNSYPYYAASRIYAVGSMAEGTRIIEPDEFDYIVVLRFSQGTDFRIQQALVNHRNQENALHDLDADFRHLHLRMCKGTTIPNTLTHNGCLRNWTEIIFPRGETLVFKNKYKRYKNVQESGELEFCNSVLNGPAITLQLVWKPRHGRNLSISVDVVLAIETKDASVSIEGEITKYPKYKKFVKRAKTYLVIPIKKYFTENEPSICFKKSFVQIELAIMKRMSQNHKICYRFLKYLLQELDTNIENKEVNTYVLKTTLIKHSANCKENSNAAMCIMNVIKCLQENLFHEDLFIKKTISCNQEDFNFRHLREGIQDFHNRFVEHMPDTSI